MSKQTTKPPSRGVKPAKPLSAPPQPTSQGSATNAPAGGPAPLAGPVPVLEKGRIVLPGAKAPRTKRIPVAVPLRVIGALLVVPAVLNEIEFHGRRATVKAANVMIAHGISANKAARALGVAPSRLSAWRAAYAERGEDGLRPKPWNAGRRKADGRQRRAPAFLEFLTKPR